MTKEQVAALARKLDLTRGPMSLSSLSWELAKEARRLHQDLTPALWADIVRAAVDRIDNRRGLI